MKVNKLRLDRFVSFAGETRCPCYDCDNGIGGEMTGLWKNRHGLTEDAIPIRNYECVKCKLSVRWVGTCGNVLGQVRLSR